MIAIVSPDLKRLAAGAKVFPKPLRAAIRRELTAIGREAANASKANIRSMPSAGTRSFSGRSGLRRDIASAIRVGATASTSRGVALKIRVAQTGPLEDHRRFRLAQLLDRGRPFPHKDYGRWTDPKIMQADFPYFEKEIEARAPAMQAAAYAALAEATRLTIPNVR